MGTHNPSKKPEVAYVQTAQWLFKNLMGSRSHYSYLIWCSGLAHMPQAPKLPVLTNLVASKMFPKFNFF